MSEVPLYCRPTIGAYGVVDITFEEPNWTEFHIEFPRHSSSPLGPYGRLVSRLMINRKNGHKKRSSLRGNLFSVQKNNSNRDTLSYPCWLGFRISGSGFRVMGLGFRVSGVGF
jgi:hypothetical protein